MTVSLRLNDELARKLDSAAAAAGVSKSEFLRRCLTDRLEEVEPERPSAWELGKDLFGCCASETGDLSVRAEEIVREKVHAKYAAQRRRRHGTDGGPLRHE